MSLFSVQQVNDLRIRAQNIYGENIFVQESGSWVPVKPGGGEGPVELPYYAKPTEIEMDNGVGKGLVIDPTGITFGDDSGNKTIDAQFARKVDLDLSTLKDTTVPALTTRVTNVENVNTTQGTNITALQTKTANITQAAGSNCISYNSGVATRALIIPSGLHVYNSSSTNAPTYPHVKIDPTSIAIATSSSGSVYLDATRVDNLAKLTSVTTSDFNDKLNLTKGVTFPGAVETVDTSNKKMVVMDATTKALSYATIPSGGGGATLPAYIEPTRINLEDRSDTANTRAVIMNGNSITIRPNIDNPSPTSGDYVALTNGQVEASRYGASGTSRTILRRLGVDFYNGSSTPAVLDYAAVMKLLSLGSTPYIRLSSADCFTHADLSYTNPAATISWPYGTTPIVTVDMTNTPTLKLALDLLPSTHKDLNVSTTVRQLAVFMHDSPGVPTNVNQSHWEFSYLPSGNDVNSHLISFKAYRRLVSYFTDASKTSSVVVPVWLFVFTKSNTTDAAALNGTIMVKRWNDSVVYTATTSLPTF